VSPAMLSLPMTGNGGELLDAAMQHRVVEARLQ
jgi:hypothetical protein